MVGENTTAFAKRMLQLACMAMLCLCLLAGSLTPVYGQDADPAAPRMNFPDVSASHWGYPYITKLALQGIVQGDQNGYYNPSDNVRQQDAIIMAINFMGLQETALSVNASGVLPFEVDAYARPYVKLALDIGLIDAREELLYETDYADLSWGKRPATREWVAKITVRVIQQDEAAEQLANQMTQFLDNNDISAWALGYINQAVSLDIVSGFDDNRFRPKDLVTRAQMAVFLSRSEPYLKTQLNRVYHGMVSAVNGNNITIETKDGDLEQFRISSQAAIYNSSEGMKFAGSSDIKPFYDIYVIAVDNTAYYIEILNDQISMETFEGILVAKDVDNSGNRTVIVLTDGEYLKFTLAANVMITDTDGNGLSYGVLTQNSELVLQRPADTDKEEIVQMIVTSIPINKSGEGEVVGLEDSHLIVNTSDGVERYPLSAKALITYGNRILDSADELNKGDKISYQIEDSAFTRIELETPAVPIMSYADGIIDSVNKDRIILYGFDQSISGYFFAENATVHLSGKSNASVSDLMAGDRVKITLNQANEAIHVEILDREIENAIRIEIFDYDEKTSSVVLRLNDSLETFKLNDDTLIQTDSVKISKENFPNLFTRGKLVDIVYSKDQLITIKISSFYDGTVEKIDLENKALTLQVAQFGNVTFEFDNVIIISPVENLNNIEALKVGDRLRISLNSNQNEISVIELHKTLVYEVISVDHVRRFYTVRGSDAKIKNILINQNVPVDDADGKKITHAQIVAGEPIMVSYLGVTVEEVNAPAVTEGKIWFVDQTNNTLGIRTYDGFIRTFNLDKEITIVKDDKAYGTLKDAQLSSDDRVEIAVDKAGNVYIEVMVPEIKVFWKYDSRTETVSFRRANLSEKFEFKLDENAFIHRNLEEVSPSDFSDYEEVIVYLSGDKIVEMTSKGNASK